MAIVDEPDIQPDPGDTRHQLFRLVQGLERPGPLFASHIHDTEIGIGGARTRIDVQNLAEIAFGLR